MRERKKERERERNHTKKEAKKDKGEVKVLLKLIQSSNLSRIRVVTDEICF